MVTKKERRVERSRNLIWWTGFVPPGSPGLIKEQPRSLGHGERQGQVGDRNHGFPSGARSLEMLDCNSVSKENSFQLPCSVLARNF